MSSASGILNLDMGGTAGASTESWVGEWGGGGVEEWRRGSRVGGVGGGVEEGGVELGGVGEWGGGGVEAKAELSSRKAEGGLQQGDITDNCTLSGKLLRYVYKPNNPACLGPHHFSDPMEESSASVLCTYFVCFCAVFVSGAENITCM